MEKITIIKNSKIKGIIILSFIIFILTGCQNKDENIIKKAQVINISEPNEDISIEINATINYIENLENTDYTKINEIEENIKQAQICINENQEIYNNNLFQYEKNLGMIEISKNKISEDTIKLNKYLRENIQNAINLIDVVITKNDSDINFSNIFSVKDISQKNKLRNLYNLAEEQSKLLCSLDNENKINTKKIKELITTTQELLDIGILAIQSSINSIYFKQEELDKIKNDIEFYKHQINDDYLKLKKNIDEIENTKKEIVQNQKNIYTTSKNINSNLQKCKIDLSDREQEKIFELWETKNKNKFHKKIGLSIEQKYIKYMEIGETLYINNINKAVLSKIINKENKIEVYLDKNIEIKTGDSVFLNININNYINKNSFYILPKEYLILDEQKNKVYSIENNTVVEKNVEYMDFSENKIIVTSGILNGDQILKNPKYFKIGEMVEIEEY